MKKLNDKECIVGPVRLSYMNVFAPKANDLKEGAKEYSVTLLIPKTDTEQLPDAATELSELRGLLKSAVFAKWGERPPAKLRSPIRDGDTETDAAGDPKAPGYWFMNVSAKEMYPPMLIDGARQKVTGGWQSGDWGRVHLSIFAYDTKGNRGVSAGLRAIQFTHHGEALGGASASVDHFDQLEVPRATANAGSPPDEYDPFADE